MELWARERSGSGANAVPGGLCGRKAESESDPIACSGPIVIPLAEGEGSFAVGKSQSSIGCWFFGLIGALTHSIARSDPSADTSVSRSMCILQRLRSARVGCSAAPFEREAVATLCEPNTSCLDRRFLNTSCCHLRLTVRRANRLAAGANKRQMLLSDFR